MKYNEPNMEIISFGNEDIIRTSLTPDVGGGPHTEGPWAN